MAQTTNELEAAAAQAATGLPEAVRASALAACLGDGVIRPSLLDDWYKAVQWTPNEAMAALLPLAASLGHAPVSGFKVGAVAACRRRGSEGDLTLYMGANLEFAGASLSDCVHAEQAAVVRAWLDGALTLVAVATNAAPCGHCRQFLTEVRSAAGGVSVLTPTGRLSLAQLLPEPFDPGALGIEARIFDPTEPSVILSSEVVSKSDLAQVAARAALQSHTPYSGSPAGIGLRLANGQVVSGRACESVAFNPSLSPLQAALVRMGAHAFRSNPVIEAVLVEHTGNVSHTARDGRILATVAPQVSLAVLKLPPLDRAGGSLRRAT